MGSPLAGKNVIFKGIFEFTGVDALLFYGSKFKKGSEPSIGSIKRPSDGH